MAHQTRGSLKLLQQRCKRVTLEEEDLSRFMEVVDFEGVELVDVFCFGQPRPDVISGSLNVNREVYDRLSNLLINLEDLRFRRWEVFPLGIPVIENLLVNFEITRGFRG